MKIFVESKKGNGWWTGISETGRFIKFKPTYPSEIEGELLKAFTDRKLIEIKIGELETLKILGKKPKKESMSWLPKLNGHIKDRRR